MFPHKTYETLSLECRDQLATITFLTPPPESHANSHWELGQVFSDLRGDNSVRVIVIQGSGGHFKIQGPKEGYESENKNEKQDPRKTPSWAWNTFTGVIRCHQNMAEIEKPIIAKINGDAVAFGSSIAFASDFIIADENAIFMDSHMGATYMATFNGEHKIAGHDFSIVPGDGGCALIPLHMTPCKAKEYLMLCQSYTGAELAKLGIINYAVKNSELDSKVQEIVDRLLLKDAFAVARTKRLVNRQVVESLNRTLDAGVGYEMVSFLQPKNITQLN